MRGDRAAHPGKLNHVTIDSSAGTLVVSAVTGHVVVEESIYDGDDLRNIVRFDVHEWERWWRQIFDGGDILDYAFWNRDGSYESAVMKHREFWLTEILPVKARDFMHFEMNPGVLLDGSNDPVAFDDPTGMTFEAAPGSKDSRIACWSVYGFKPDTRWECISDHRTEADASFHLDRWIQTKAKFT